MNDLTTAQLVDNSVRRKSTVIGLASHRLIVETLEENLKALRRSRDADRSGYMAKLRHASASERSHIADNHKLMERNIQLKNELEVEKDRKDSCLFKCVLAFVVGVGVTLAGLVCLAIAVLP